MNHEKCLEKIKSNAANLIVVSALYIGYAFFEVSLLFDSIILLVLGLIILKWKSSIASSIAFIFGLISVYFLVNSSSSDAIRFLAAGTIVWSGALSMFYTIKLPKLSSGV